MAEAAPRLLYRLKIDGYWEIIMYMKVTNTWKHMYIQENTFDCKHDFSCKIFDLRKNFPHMYVCPFVLAELYPTQSFHEYVWNCRHVRDILKLQGT